jgi:filamentous hemagglutinin
MNRNCYRLVFNTTLGMMVPVAETARRAGKAGSGKTASGAALALAGALLTGAVHAELPVASANFAAPGTTASYQASGTQAYLNQVGNKAVVNFQSFNISAGHDVQFRQVDGLATQNLVPGANFASLVRIHDINPSIIAGSISQAAGQHASVTMINSNGIAFMGSAQVNVNNFTASTLNMQDGYLGNFLPGTGDAQFENALDGGEAHGFIKVLEGAQITAGTQGRVMLIAPTVVNKGTVKAADGQVIAAAGAKVYLRSASGDDDNVRGLLVEVDSPAGLADFETANSDVKDGVLDGQTVSLANAVEDKLGHVTNLGELSTPRGNVTMVGYAVNQMGIARATTSVIANGSVYLLAKDTKAQFTVDVPESLTDISSSRGGRVLLGANSLTEILPETGDQTAGLDGTTGAGLAKASQIKVLGQDIRMAGGAVIDAPAAELEFRAVDKPNDTQVLAQAGTAASDTARIHIASGARINVAGLENVQVSAARNSVEVELRGDELKDSPVNQQGVLNGEKVYVDINRALANSDAGQSTLIARDSLESYQAKLERTVAERSTAGGKVSLLSEGETILENGALIDLSGGSVAYTAANVKTTLLTAGGISVDLADANAETRYDGIATRFVKDYGRWNVKKVIDLGQSYRSDPGYIEGKDAGSLDIVGMKAVVMQADVQGRTTVGELQRDAGIQPAGAQLTIGNHTEGITGADNKLNQRVEIASSGSALPVGFKFGDALSQDLKDTLVLNPALMGKDKVAQLEIFSNQAAEVREALRVPQGGSVKITAESVAVKADIQATAGTIALTASRNMLNGNPSSLDVTVADGVSLSARGDWANDQPGVTGQSGDAALIDGGTVSLTAAGNVVLGEASEVDVSGGARVKPDGTVDNGNGGDVTLDAGQAMQLGGEVRGYALGKGGTYALKAQKIKVGGAPDAAALNLDAAFFERGGFASFELTGANGVDIADGTVIRPTVISRELLAGYAVQQTGSDIDTFTRLLKQDDLVRQAADLSLTAVSLGGTVRLGDNAKILADDQAHVSFKSKSRIELLGEVHAAGGHVSASVSRSASEFEASSAVWLGANSVIDVSGAARTYVDNRGLTQGKVLDGGSVELNAENSYVVTAAGSRIKVSGAAPVRLDELNENGGLGRNVGSDAGSVTVSSTEGVLLDGSIEAHAGSATNRGGVFSLSTTAKNPDVPPDPGAIAPQNQRVLSLAAALAPQAAGLAPGDAIPDALNGHTRVATQPLEAAGFDQLQFASGTISLEDGLDLGAGKALPLRALTLDAMRIETAGGNAALTADSVKLGNYGEFNSPDAAAPAAAAGTFEVHARQIELAGKMQLDGMARAELNGSEEIRLAGGFSKAAVPEQSVFNVDVRPSGELNTHADLVFRSPVVAPATFVQYSILAPGKMVRFMQGAAAPQQPFSAYGSLTVKAQDIVQGGSVWAPLGRIELQADNALTFEPGSLTSVAADANSLIPFGKLQNSRNWVFDLGLADSESIAVDEPQEKSIVTAAAMIDMQSGAIIDLSGGGDVQAYEFSVGPGGSRDILADKNTYAILPGYTGGFAPGNAQESFDRASGEAVYLSGVPGLKDGIYTLLPAHFALLPGAYAVKLDSGIGNVLPGQAYSRQDGVRIAAGYVTDTRMGAPRDANWQGIQVMTRDQVRARSEYSLTRGSEFFAASRMRPQDAGRLSVSTNGSGAAALKLDATYDFAAGVGGRGAQVDISALNLAVVSGTPVGIDPDAVVLDVGTLNALGADSLLIGGTRSSGDTTTTLAVGAESVTLANDAAHALHAGEILLAATDTLTLKSGSAIDAQGEPGEAGAYETAGNGAFVRAASTTATFVRTGSPDRSQGSLIGEAGSTIAAANSIALDATLENAYQGDATFVKNGATVAGNLAVGATRVNFGAAPTGAEGITYSQAQLDALDLKSLALTSYSTFDLYGDVSVGQLDAAGKPVMQNLTLQGAGIAGVNNAGQTARINAQSLTLANAGGAAFAPGGTPGSGSLDVTVDTLALGAGDKAIQGFGAVSVTANELVATAGTGTLDIDAPATLAIARISGEQGAKQNLTASGALTVAQHTADRALTPVTALGAEWALRGSTVDFDTHAELPSGRLALTATNGDVDLGSNARIDVAGRSVQFFDVAKSSWGGTAEFVSETGNVSFADGANVDVSAAAGADAGSLVVRAKGTFTAADGSVSGAAPVNAAGERGDGARADIDSGTLADFSALNTTLNSGGFDGERALRVRSGDVVVAVADAVKANTIKIAADNGKLDVAGTLDASGKKAGRIELFAMNDVNVLATAALKAESSGANEDGGDIEIGSRDGNLNLLAGSTMAVSGGAGGAGGTVRLRALRTANDVKIGALDSAISGARSVSVEAVKTYAYVGDTSLTSAELDTIKADNDSFAANHAAIKNRLGVASDPAFHILSGVDIHATGDLTLAADWNLSTARAGAEAGMLTLAADGNLNIVGSLSDGFVQATPMKSGSNPAELLADESWGYRLVAGADADAADPMAVKASAVSVSLAANKLIRTGTGDIRVASGGDVVLGNDKSVIYTAGRRADALAGFTDPAWSNATLISNFAQFSQGGGDVSFEARGNIVGAVSSQIFNNWLFRQGKLSADGTTYDVQPAWWVRFDQFRQGVGALGGGDVSLRADGNIENLSAHTPTQARTASATPDSSALVQTGGGTVRVEAGGDVLGGQYFADRGDVVLKAGGQVGSSGQMNNNGQLIYTILALGDGAARVNAQGDVNLNAVFNPTLFNQSRSNSSSTAKSVFNVTNNSGRDSVFSTYADASAARLQSLGGATRLHSVNSLVTDTALFLKPLNDNQSPEIYGLDILPPNFSMVAFQGELAISDAASSGTLVMLPVPSSTLELLASQSLNLNATLIMSDRDPGSTPSPILPGNPAATVNPVTNWYEKAVLGFHAPIPLHSDDSEPVVIYAVKGDIVGGSPATGNQVKLDLPKAFSAHAGRDIRNLTIEAQHADDINNLSRVQAGRDIVFASYVARTEEDHIHLGGSGSLDVVAGRDIDLGTSGGIVSRGNTVNPALSVDGADIRMAAGVGEAGVDYSGAVDRLLAKLDTGATDEETLWQARWLTGDANLTAGNALAAVQAVAALDAPARQASVRNMLFTALRETGRDSNKAGSPYAGDYARGYAAIELVFPGISDRNPDGSFANYQGGINLFASRVKTESGGDIEWLVPGGDMIVGLSNTPKVLVDTGSNVLGIVAAGEGDVRGVSRGDVLVNQSRILTVGGGDVLLWSSEGDIDAGKGKKTAVAVPPPLILVDSLGNVTQVLQGATSGSGIGALQPSGGTAGDVDLIAPKGTVNAGDAGIRAGNLNIAAQVVLGADNISVSGSSSGTPVADTSAVTAASSGASNADGGMGDATAALSSNLADAARAAEEMKQAFKPTFITAEVVGHGE